MARTGSEVVKITTVGQFLRYQPKGSSEFFKAELKSKAKDKVSLLALAGPRFDNKKTKDQPFSISKEEWDARIKGAQGRPQGYSPVAKEASPEPAKQPSKPAKASGKPAKANGKAAPAASNEEYDLDSVKSELTDIIEYFKDALEAAQDKLASLENISNFMETLQLGDDSPAADEEDEEEPAKPAKSRRGGRSKPMHDEDEEDAA